MTQRGTRVSGPAATAAARSDDSDSRPAVQYSLQTTRTVEREEASDLDPTPDARAEVTARHVELSGFEGDPITVPHTAINSVRRERRIVRRWFVVDTDEDTYRLVPEAGDDADAAVSYVRSAIWDWRDADRLLSDARGHVTTMGRAIESGDEEQAARERRQVARALAKARGTAESADVAGPAIRNEADRIEEESARTRVQRHLARSNARRSAATEAHESLAYETAHDAYSEALDHAETAAAVAAEYGFREEAAIESERRQLREALAELAAEPLARAQQALRSVRDTADPQARADALEVAIDRYRTVLEVGWGRPATEFDGSTGAVRMQVSWLVARYVETARAAAEDLVSTAESAEESAPTERYREATDYLSAAIEYASQYRQGDPEALAARKDELDLARADLEWQWGGETAEA